LLPAIADVAESNIADVANSSRMPVTKLLMTRYSSGSVVNSSG
jgi:hypothetical protein